jgi:hypothetical protein
MLMEGEGKGGAFGCGKCRHSETGCGSCVSRAFDVAVDKEEFKTMAKFERQRAAAEGKTLTKRKQTNFAMNEDGFLYKREWRSGAHVTRLIKLQTMSSDTRQRHKFDVSKVNWLRLAEKGLGAKFSDTSAKTGKRTNKSGSGLKNVYCAWREKYVTEPAMAAKAAGVVRL